MGSGATMSNYYGMVPITAGQRAKADIGASGLSGVLLGNESGLSVTVTLDGCGHSRRLYPGTVDFFPIPRNLSFNGNVLLDPSANLSNASSWPSSYIDVDTFGPNEAPTGIYPMALPRNTNVGNAVSTVGGGSSFIQNDANVAGTSIVEATVSGDSGSAVSLTNDGVLKIGTAAHPGSVSFDHAKITSDGAGNFAVTGKTTTGTFSSDGAAITSDGFGDLTVAELITTSSIIIPNNVSIDAKDSGGVLRQILLLSSGNETQLLGVPGNGALTLQSDTNAVWKIRSGGQGPQLLTGTIAFLAGSLSRITVFSGTGNATVNTGLGTTPTTICTDCTTVSGSTQTIGFTNAQSSVVSTGAGLAWNGTAIKT